MGLVVVLLLAFLVWLGAFTSWQIAAIPGIFAAIAVYGFIDELSKLWHAKEPALSLLADGLVARQGNDKRHFAYEDLYSVEVEVGRGIHRMVIRFFDLGRITTLSLNSAELDTPSETILEEVAKRIPLANNPRSGKGILICSPPDIRANHQNEAPKSECDHPNAF